MAIDKIFSNPLIQSLKSEWLSKANVQLSILRLDALHPEISGNKWYKLKENIKEARQQKKNTLLTFGGVWSNHLIATAAAAKLLGFSSIGVIRGYSENEEESETLKRCEAFGMKLLGSSREHYRRKYDPAFLENLQHQYPEAMIIPEGGNNDAGRSGAAEIAKWIPANVHYIVLSVGTGTTFEGIRSTVSQHINMIGFAPFKKVEEQEDSIRKFCSDVSAYSWKLFPDPVWFGFGKHDERLISFMNEFFNQFQIPLDIIYTAKMMYYLKQQIQANMFPSGSKILAIHSGGLQGNFSVRNLLDY